MPKFDKGYYIDKIFIHKVLMKTLKKIKYKDTYILKSIETHKKKIKEFQMILDKFYSSK